MSTMIVDRENVRAMTFYGGAARGKMLQLYNPNTDQHVEFPYAIGVELAKAIVEHDLVERAYLTNRLTPASL